jgi:succinate-acetate transporter protein
MKGFFKNAGWILLAVFCFVVALVFVYYGIVELTRSSWGWATGAFIGAIVFFAFTVSGFRQAKQ